MSYSSRRLIVRVRRSVVAIVIIGVMGLPLSASQAEVIGEHARRTYELVTVLLRKTVEPSNHSNPLAKPQAFEAPTERATRVRYLRLCPRKLLLYVGEDFTLVPTPLDHDKEAVHGADLIWSSKNTSIANVLSWGEVSAIAPGVTQVTVESGNTKAHVNVEVRAGVRPKLADRTQRDPAWDTEHGRDCDDPETAAGLIEPQEKVATTLASVPITSGNDGVRYADSSPLGNEWRGSERSFDASARPAMLYKTSSAIGQPIAATAGATPARNASARALFQPGIILDGDGGDPIGAAAAAPSNAVGNPRFAAIESGQGGATKTRNILGSYDYVFTAPVLGLGGRGIGVNLALTYNSRVWSKESSGMTFNYGKGWPAPGWTIGFGRLIEDYDGLGNWLLIQPEGTRIHLELQGGTLVSTDGTFIKVDEASGELRYSDGTRVNYDKINNRWLPASIRTRNGDLITLSYRQYQKFPEQPNYFPVRWAIDQITDTLGRITQFRYFGDSGYPEDSTGAKPKFAVAAILAPDQGGGTRTMVQLQYQTITLQYNFNVPVNQSQNPASGSQLTMLRRIYYPATGQGYLFQDYNSYGMCRHISVRNNMTGAGGAVTDGNEIAYTKYNYVDVITQTGQLNDSPQYTTRSEWWQGKIDDPTATVYSYSRAVDTVNLKETMTISYPTPLNVATLEMTTENDSSLAGFGTLISTKYKSGANTLRRIDYTYLSPAEGGVQLDTVTTTNEAGQVAKTSYDYTGAHGRVDNVNEFGFSPSVQRRTHFRYSDNSEYLNKNMLHLVTRVELFNNAGTKVARTDYTLDDYAVTGGMQTYAIMPPSQTHDPDFDQNKIGRGNVTGVTQWTDIAQATTLPQTNGKYDIFGNVVRADVSCCKVKNTNFLDGSGNPSTFYSQPMSVTDGTPNVTPFLTTNFQYDFNTGLLVSTIDSDGQATSFIYDSGWRLLTMNAPSLATATTKFDKDGNGNDQLAYQSQVTYKEKDSDPDTLKKTLTNKSWFDGAGNVLRSGSGAGTSPTSFDTVATVYDAMGRVQKGSNPYAGDSSGNGSPSFWTINVYDALSRVKEVDLPDDQPSGQRSTVLTDYAGATVTVTDQVGRKRKSEVDGLDRLIKVTEQNAASGNLDWETTYAYDTLDNLTGVNQGGQTRSFAYDAVSRMTSQTTPEAGGVNFTYTDFGAVLKRKDARNVETHHKYDSLNRLIQVWYTGLGGSDDPTVVPRPPLPTGVAATTDVTVTYKTAAPGNGQVNQVTDGPGTESYGFDNLGRATSKTFTIDTVHSYQTQYQYNQISQLRLMIYPSGKRVRMNYDSRGRLIGQDKVDAADSFVSSYVSGIGYNLAGQVTGMTSGSGVVESYAYSPDRLQLTRQTAMKGGATLMDLNYSYAAAAGASGVGTTPGNSGQLMTIGNNPVGQPSKINEQPRNQAFTYDDLGRLVTATGWGVWQRRYAYDRWGNRTGVWDATLGGNQIQSVGLQQQGGVPTNRLTSVTTGGVPATQAYDAAGNLTSDGAHTYQYDGEGRLAKVDAGTGNEASYYYDSANRRVKKVWGGHTTYYVWEGAQVIAEYSNAPAGVGGTSYYLADRLSNRMITDGDGAFKGAQDHLPFGEEGGTSGTIEKHRFTTYERDSESVTDYAINRQYGIASGRFLQPDPMLGTSEAPQSLHRYSYTNGDPINLVDPLGLEECFKVQLDGTLKPIPCSQIKTDSNGGIIVRPWDDNPLLPDWSKSGYSLFIDGWGTMAGGPLGLGPSALNPTQNEAPLLSEYQKCVAACVADVGINVGLGLTPVGMVTLGATGTELSLVQNGFGYEDTLYTSGLLDYVEAGAQNVSSLINWAFRGSGGDHKLNKAIEYTRRGRGTSGDFKVRQGRIESRLGKLKLAGRISGALSVALKLWDIGSDIKECFDKCCKFG